MNVTRKYFLDTSALAKLYVRESGTEMMLDLAANAPPRTLVALTVSRVEVHSAVRRRVRSGSVSENLADEILKRFEAHWASFFLVQPAAESILARAVELLQRRPLRALDAIQLAGCLAFREADPDCSGFVCADAELVAAAVAEGMPAVTPA